MLSSTWPIFPSGRCRRVAGAASPTCTWRTPAVHGDLPPRSASMKPRSAQRDAPATTAGASHIFSATCRHGRLAGRPRTRSAPTNSAPTPANPERPQSGHATRRPPARRTAPLQPRRTVSRRGVELVHRLAERVQVADASAGNRSGEHDAGTAPRSRRPTGRSASRGERRPLASAVPVRSRRRA